MEKDNGMANKKDLKDIEWLTKVLCRTVDSVFVLFGKVGIIDRDRSILSGLQIPNNLYRLNFVPPKIHLLKS